MGLCRYDVDGDVDAGRKSFKNFEKFRKFIRVILFGEVIGRIYILRIIPSSELHNNKRTNKQTEEKIMSYSPGVL